MEPIQPILPPHQSVACSPISSAFAPETIESKRKRTIEDLHLARVPSRLATDDPMRVDELLERDPARTVAREVAEGARTRVRDAGGVREDRKSVV